jgi:nucleolar protein 56
MKYLYSNAKGSYVYDDNFRLIESIPFANPEKACILLEKNEWTDEEKKLVANHHGKLMFLGFKNEASVPLTQDIEKLEGVTLKQNALESKAIITLVTKEKIRDTFSRDLLILHVSSHIEELGKATNILVKRLREWYGLVAPDISKTADNENLAKLASTGRKSGDKMGVSLAKKDLERIEELGSKICSLYELKASQEKYLEDLMKEICPNLNAVAGTLIGAKLLAIAGTLKKLSEMPASTIQLLGAEKALFRHLRNRSQRVPKYGVLFQHQLVSNASPGDRGRVARALADKIAIAVKVDYFKGEFVGKKLAEGLEKRFAK